MGVTAPDAVFGNSVHDAAMLAIARRAFPVNPTPRCWSGVRRRVGRFTIRGRSSLSKAN